jgi:replicative DNA helicase
MTLTAPHAGAAPHTAAELLERIEHPDASPGPDRSTALPTGLQPLDDVLSGGFRAQDLVLLGGRPGVGKTIVALQWARESARHGHTSLFICYEHSPEALLARLLSLEAGALARPDELPALHHLRALASEVALGSRALDDLTREPLGEEAVGRVRAYGDCLHIVAASGRSTGVEEIEQLTRARASGPTTVFVDYLQKIPFLARNDDQDARTTHVVEALKDLAMSTRAAVVAIAAADRAGFEARRLRLHHLRGSTALAHECDLALLMNEKAVVVSKAHLAFDPVRAETFHRKVVISVEKNRRGPAGLDLEFEKDFASYRLVPQGGFVAEKLVDEVLLAE